MRTDVDPRGSSLPTIARDAPVGFEVDTLLSPRSVTRATVQVISGGAGIFGRVSYDPARRRVEFAPDAGAQRPGLEYVLVVRAELASWDGVRLGETLQRRFVAGTEAFVTPTPTAGPQLRRDVAPILQRRCATSGCHRSPNAVLALDLSSPEAIVRTAVDVSSIERRSVSGAPSERTDPQWGSLLRIDRGLRPGEGEPAYSYLLYKILGDGPTLGTRMPPPDVAPLNDAEVRTIADWIRRGAPDD